MLAVLVLPPPGLAGQAWRWLAAEWEYARANGFTVTAIAPAVAALAMLHAGQADAVIAARDDFVFPPGLHVVWPGVSWTPPGAMHPPRAAHP